ncbi:MAG TPA: hypothetical protein VIU63_03885 [Nitrospira sp.]
MGERSHGTVERKIEENARRRVANRVVRVYFFRADQIMEKTKSNIGRY